MATSDAQVAVALLTEHLQYTPLSLIDDIINSVNDLIYQGISSLENGLFSTPPDRLGFKASLTDSAEQDQPHNEKEFPDGKQEIEEGLHKLETLLESTVDKNFDKFEIYVLRNILSVPEDLIGWIKLSHYENLALPPTNNPHTLEAVQLLRRKVAASRTVSSTLADEVARNNTIIAQIRAVTQAAPSNKMMQSDPKTSPHGQFSFLEDSASAKALGISPARPAVQPLTTNTTFTLSQLPTVKAILTDLRSQLLNRSAMEQNRWSARDERRRERRDYIEQRTRSHLERNGQQSLTSTTGFREKQVDRDEIEAMEKAASVFETQR